MRWVLLAGGGQGFYGEEEGCGRGFGGRTASWHNCSCLGLSIVHPHDTPPDGGPPEGLGLLLRLPRHPRQVQAHRQGGMGKFAWLPDAPGAWRLACFQQAPAGVFFAKQLAADAMRTSIPTPQDLLTCEDSGRDLALAVKKKARAREAAAAPGQRAVSVASGPQLAAGRLVGSLSVLTARNDDANAAMLASWISQVRGMALVGREGTPALG